MLFLQDHLIPLGGQCFYVKGTGFLQCGIILNTVVELLCDELFAYILENS